MALTLSEPKIIVRGPYLVVGAYCVYEGEDEGPGWNGAYEAFSQRQSAITHRTDDLVLGFLYWPHRDDASIPEDTRACFVGVEVTDLDHAPADLATTRFSGGEYVVVACQGETGAEAAEGVGQAIGWLSESWMPKHGYCEGDACFAASKEHATRPPHVEYVYIKLEKGS